MGIEGKPDKVKKARVEGDTAALSAMGKKGGKEAAITRGIKREDVGKLENAIETPEGDILPPDPGIEE